MTVYRDLGYHFPVFRDNQVESNESQYWKRLKFAARLDDAFKSFGPAKIDDGGTAGTADDEIVCVAPLAMELRKIWIVPENAHTGQNTDYASIGLVNKESGSGSDDMGSQDYTSGNDLVAYDANDLTVSGTQSNRQVAMADVVQVSLTKTGNGQALDKALVFAEFEDFIDIGNGISDVATVVQARKRLLVVGAYVIPLAGDITGQDTHTASINIVNKSTDGSGTVEIAGVDFTNGNDATQDVPKSMTLNTTISNRVIERGEEVVAELVKSGTGLQLNEVSVVLVCKAIEQD